MSQEPPPLKKVTLKMPQDLYLKYLKRVISKHKGVYGHLNKEFLTALEYFAEKEPHQLGDL